MMKSFLCLALTSAALVAGMAMADATSPSRSGPSQTGGFFSPLLKGGQGGSLPVAPPPKTSPGPSAEPSSRPLADSLRATEAAFAKSVADGDATLFASFIADDAVFLSEPALRGKKAIVEGWSVFFGKEAPKIEWAPKDAEVNDAGDLGITRGPYTVTSTGKDGTIHISKGTFMSIWKHQTDGTWKIIFDGGAPGCPGA